MFPALFPICIHFYNKHLSNLAKRGISPPKSSTVFAKWQQQFGMFWQGVWLPKICPSPGHQESTSNTVSLDRTSVHAKWHLNPSNGVSRGHKSDRQTDHVMEKFVMLGGIACETAIPPNNNNKTHLQTHSGNIRMFTPCRGQTMQTWLVLEYSAKRNCDYVRKYNGSYHFILNIEVTKDMYQPKAVPQDTN